MTKEQILWEISKKTVPYPQALSRMEAIARDIRAQEAPERVWLLEHPPLYTAGTSARAEDLFNPAGYPTYPAGRGGQWTYHGPGQRIAYAMLDLQRPHGNIPPRDLRAYVHALESWIIAALARFGIKGEVREGRVGVWVQDPASGMEEKIAAIGVRVSRWVSWHGIAINVAPRLEDFDGIVPCGIREFGVTSFRRLGLDTDMAALDQALAECWPTVFGSQPSPLQPVEPSLIPA
ncbi:lipoyl(octanoyl) transferase LipB [Acetobacter peroxydans]|jgi:lipoyl(octanoyl) transferase|uniref:lipoyl(octanoyl) transferase LipB n=1 Tax=Acetobacter peroxydans TaxID=104098 RepID=UPI0023540989|nr:lipoyl(octanoyl) transferase LipB [Acetobacter peroxydans]MCH4143737.1 lipoyl(octanoyl) transferase LipB [Acetobacter peroxydans]MCI1410093.1 lipoyl(octanoyl) transferase LipB [Acetobacter peroxydans]MCI1566851.1 lipoyl(octanoyl) transferase LipB [Acetobacter peroxydans]MCI1617780.1 lipoyl(octanoyl) transferase LipB [Acetobacter peroxydans]MCI1726047.1 lipoyl(octanoyl) transferase LipB [Acetobacter peroxydans]